MNEIASLYSTSQQGGELPYFVGKQYGTGWLRTLGRFAFPILKRLGRAAFNTASDVIMKNKNILPTIKSHAMDAVSYLPSLIKTEKPSINNRKKRRHSTIFTK